MDLQGIASFTDYFVICTGTSDRMLDALAKGVTDDLRKKHRLKTPQPEGNASYGWLVLDFGNVIVHLFAPDQRQYYRLEELWSAGKIILRLQ